MKKDTKMLAVFLAMLSTAVFLGILAGKFVAAAESEIVLSPAVYMQKIVYAAPYFMILAIVLLIICVVKTQKGHSAKKLAKYTAVYVFEVIGIIVSGFCGMYTMAHFIPIAVAIASGVVVLLALAVLPAYENSYVIHSRKQTKSTAEYIVFIVWSAVVVLSAFMPTGPLPVMVTGAVWCVTISRNNHR